MSGRDSPSTQNFLDLNVFRLTPASACQISPSDLLLLHLSTKLILLWNQVTSTTLGYSGSIEGTCLVRMPMSPVAAAILTWVTSVEVKIVWYLVQKPLK